MRPAPPAEKSKLMAGLDLFTGKAVPSDYNKKDKEATPQPSPTVATATATAGASRPVSGPPPAPPVAVPVPPPPSSSATTSTFQAAKSNPFAAGDPFDEDAEADGEDSGNPFASSSAPPAAPSAPPAPPASSGGSNFVEALFDHEAEEEDELNFATGDLVEVIDKPDGGWWRGRCHGKEGLFPSNYVKSS